jgi:hypothetical protein
MVGKEKLVKNQTYNSDAQGRVGAKCCPDAANKWPTSGQFVANQPPKRGPPAARKRPFAATERPACRRGLNFAMWADSMKG